jgi:predicted MPP superfamily phosphohydrolase
MRIFGTMLLASWSVLLLYVSWRAASVPVIARRIPRPLFAAFAAALWSTFAFGRLLGGDGDGRIAALLELVGMHALAVLFILAVPLLTVDLVTGFGFLARRRAGTLRGWALVVGLAMAGVAFVQGTRAPEVITHEVRLAGLPTALDGTVIVALSDFHLGSLLDGEWLTARVAQVEALRPDVVVLLGDLLEGHGAPPRALAEGLAGFRGPLGVYAVTGNHEYHSGRDDALRVLEEAGLQVLRDRWVEVRPGLVLAGVDDLTSRRRRSAIGDFVGAALAGRPPGAVVLLSHSPLELERAAAAGAGLVLCGHTHGGQIWPFGYLVRRAYPRFVGRYEVGGATVIVSRGAGTWGPRMRLWKRGEILRVVLRAG